MCVVVRSVPFIDSKMRGQGERKRDINRERERERERETMNKESVILHSAVSRPVVIKSISSCFVVF